MKSAGEENRTPYAMSLHQNTITFLGMEYYITHYNKRYQKEKSPFLLSAESPAIGWLFPMDSDAFPNLTSKEKEKRRGNSSKQLEIVTTVPSVPTDHENRHLLAKRMIRNYIHIDTETEFSDWYLGNMQLHQRACPITKSQSQRYSPSLESNYGQ